MRPQQSKQRWIVFLMMLLATSWPLSSRSLASLADSTKWSEYDYVDNAAVDTSERYESYLSALKNYFPWLDTSSLVVLYENDHPDWGTFVQFQQTFMDLPVIHGGAYVKAMPDGKLTFASVQVHVDISLSYETFLDNADNQEALQDFAAGYCHDIDTIDYVRPMVYARFDSSSQEWKYEYALAVFPTDITEPGQILNWASGELICDLPEFPIEIEGFADVDYQSYGEGGQPDNARCHQRATIHSSASDQASVDALGRFWNLEVGNFPNWYIESWATDGIIDVRQDDSHTWRVRRTFVGQLPQDPPPTNEYRINMDGSSGHALDLGSQLYWIDYLEDAFHEYIPEHRNGAQRNYRVRSVPRDNDALEAWSVAGEWPSIGYGTHNSRWAQWRDVTFHEFGHIYSIHRWGGIPPVTEDMQARALYEGLAYFVAAFLANDHVLAHYGPWGTGLETDRLDLTWEDYSGNPIDDGKILSSALWEYRQLLMERYAEHGFSSPEMAASYAWWVACLAMAATPETFEDFVYRMAWIDDNFGAPGNGWPTGQEMYEAFWINHHIPSFWWQNAGYDICQLSPEEPQSSTVSALGPGGTENLVSGEFGQYSIREDQGDIVFSWSSDGGTSWEGWTLNENMDAGKNPTISIRSTGNGDDLYVAWVNLVGGPSVAFRKFHVGGSVGCENFLWEDFLWEVSRTFDVDQGTNATVTNPVIIADAELPRLLLGVTSGTSTGILYWRFTGDGQELVDHGWVGGVLSPGPTSIAAYAVPTSSAIHVVWISDNQVHYRVETSYEFWTDQVVSNPNVSAERQCVTIAYSPSIHGIVIAWQEYENNHWVIKWNRASWIDGQETDPEFLDEPLSIAWTGVQLRMPSLHAYQDGAGTVQAGYPRVGLGFELLFTFPDFWHGLDSVVVSLFTGLQVDESQPNGPYNVDQWQWMAPVAVRLSRSTSVCPWIVGDPGGYSMLSLETTGSAPWDIHYDQVNLRYSTGDPEITSVPLEIDEPVTLVTPLGLGQDIVVKNGGELRIISPDGQSSDERRVYFVRGADITVEAGGKLTIEGADGAPIKFEAYDDTLKWHGITIDGGQLSMQYAEMYDCDEHCIFVNAPAGIDTPVVIENCYFDGAKFTSGGNALRLCGSSSKTQKVKNCTIDNVSNGIGLYLSGCHVNFEGVTVQDCDVANSYLNQVTGNFVSCTFRDRTTTYGVFFNGTGSTANFRCCTFENLAPFPNPGFGNFPATIGAAAGTAPTFGFESATSPVSNEFSDSSETLLSMSGSGVLPIVDNTKLNGGPGGHNNWNQRNTAKKFISWSSTSYTTYMAENQFWKIGTRTVPAKGDFYPTSTGTYDYTPYEQDAWDLCGGAGASVGRDGRDGERAGNNLDEGVDYDSLFMVAVGMEIAEDFGSAQALFQTIATEAEDYQLNWQAATHIVSTQRHLDANAGEVWIPGLISSLSAPDTHSYDLFVYQHRLLASYRTDRTEFNDAIDICTSLLGSGITYEDSILVALQIVDIQILAGEFVGGGGLDGANSPDIPAALRVTSVPQGTLLEEHLLSILNLEHFGATFSPTPVPREYQLYQNYPNPFNPTTEIRFDLPENARIELRVFNTLGQLVATLVNEVRQAGAYRALWDGKSSSGQTVSAGLYIYQLKAGSFTASKKMLLLK